MKKKLSELEKAALAWAENRVRYANTNGLGVASSRAGLRRKADKLQEMALKLKK